MVTNGPFKALLIDVSEGKHWAGFRNIELKDLPKGDVLVEIEYSSLNYKDGLAITGKGKICRINPMVAGIDLAGQIVESAAPDWPVGDRVIVNGCGLSETHWGAYSRFQRVKSEWLVRLPKNFTALQAMAIGTAGYTAALCVNALTAWNAIKTDGLPVLVTGASGGVGSVATSLLATLGYRVVAATGDRSNEPYLRELGAESIVDRAVLATPGKPLQKEVWAGAVDSVGSTTLANAIAQTVYGGAVTACGMAGGTDIPGSVLPHILRSVALIGIDSVNAPMGKRLEAWELLSKHLDHGKLDRMTRVEPFEKLPDLANDILAGRLGSGRVVIEIGQ